MTQIAIVFFSGTGTTAALAQSVADGVAAAGGRAQMLTINGEDIVAGRWQNDEIAAVLDTSDGIIFGTPTYMGSVAGQYKAFLDGMASRWYTQAWNGKTAAAFTVSSLASGDKLNCLQDLVTFGMQMGMLWIGTGNKQADGINPNGFYLGVGASASSADEITEVDHKTAHHLGRRMAALTTSRVHTDT